MPSKIKTKLGFKNLKLTPKDILLLGLPIAIFFSYHPLIYLGSGSGMHFEISVTEIYLVIFVFANIKSIWENRKQLFANRLVILASLFAVFCTITLAYTPNFIKGFMITGIVWLLFLSFLSIVSNQKIQKLIPAAIKIFVISAIIMSGFGWLQMILGAIGAPQPISLLCNGCTADLFGFARVNAFTIEPQFFGSILVVGIIILLHGFASRSAVKKPQLGALLFLVATLVLTLSRGAILSLIIAVLILFVANIKNPKRTLGGILFVLIGAMTGLLAQGIFAQVNPRVEINFHQAVASSVHQLSMGIIDIRPTIAPPSPGNDAPAAQEPAQPTDDAPIFDGYIEESTSIRTLLSDAALKVWRSSPTNAIFGVGIGGTGYALHQAFPNEIGQTEITQNKYTEILLELGLIGIAIFVGLLCVLAYTARKSKIFWAIIAAFIIQWCFFSGYPNTLHIQLTIIFLYLYIQKNKPAVRKPT